MSILRVKKLLTKRGIHLIRKLDILKFLKLEFDQMDIIDNIDVIYVKMRIPNSFKKIKVIYVPKKVFYINYYIK